MQNLKIMETTRKKKANASNNWSGWRFECLMINNNRFERFTPSSQASGFAGGY
jgi:hypothetical protein